MSLLEKLAYFGAKEKAAKEDLLSGLEHGYGKESDQDMNAKRKALRKSSVLAQLGYLGGGAATGAGLGALLAGKKKKGGMGRGVAAGIGALGGAAAGSIAGLIATRRRQQALANRTMEMRRRLGKGGYDSSIDQVIHGVGPGGL